MKPNRSDVVAGDIPALHVATLHGGVASHDAGSLRHGLHLSAVHRVGRALGADGALDSHDGTVRSAQWFYSFVRQKLNQ